MARKLDFDLSSPADLAAFRRAVLPEVRNIPSATADTPTQADEHQVVTASAAGLVTVTPPTAAVAPLLQPGFAVKYVALGAAGVAFEAGVGDTVRGALGVAQYKAATLTLLSEAAGARTWLVDGQNA